MTRKHWSRLYSLYCDNGQTGTNFERPEFERLMEDTRAGKVNCIVVKDLSRLGRIYINVRFIAVNENYDSSKNKGRTMGIDAAFKALTH